MTVELFGRIYKELSITGGALYEMILSISERVNRKTQIIRLHWQAAGLLQRIDQVTAEVGQQVMNRVASPISTQEQQESALDMELSHATTRIQEFKQSLTHVDGQIRRLKLEAIHEELLRLQQDLTTRSARLERLTIARHATAVGQPISAMPRSSSVHIASVLRGQFLLAPSEGLIFRSDDIIVLIGIESELDRLVTWFTSHQSRNTSTAKSA